mmetsp:Transcript_29459/g.51669  ORF Transcript_29459/g.51669 Transcript_29459/m.51669 type:complete len:445 (-) Transcript_29459:33-1367(-)
MSQEVLQSYLCVVIAALCFGVMYVPVKGYKTYDGTVFQWNLCSGILFGGMVLGIVCEGDIPQGNIEGMIGGGFWAISNMAVLPLVKFLGLGLGFALYHAVNLFTGYSIGRAGAFASLGIPADAGTVPWLRDAGAVALILSFIIMVFVEPAEKAPASKEEKPENCKETEPVDATSADDAVEVSDVEANVEEGVDMKAKGQKKVGKKKGYALPGGASPGLRAGAKGDEPPGQIKASLIGNRADNPDSAGGEGDVAAPAPDVLPPSEEASEEEQDLEEGPGKEIEAEPSRDLCFVRLLGILLALFAGGTAGVNAVPFDLWRVQHPTKPKGAFVFPQALGCWIVSSVIYLGNAISKRVLQRQWPPQPLIMPAFVSGILWSCGFVFMCLAIEGIGWTAAYTFDAIGPVFVASLVSVLWFKEITDKVQLRLYVFCCTVQAFGVALIALGT